MKRILLGSILFFSFQIFSETQTFVCKNWEGGLFANENGENEGTMMIGEKNGKTVKIRNYHGTKVVLNYMGKFNATGTFLYQSISPDKYIGIYAISKSSDYDFSITHLSVVKEAQTETHCNYQ